MFRFANPHSLYLLILLPIFVAIYWYACKRRKHNITIFGDYILMKPLMPRLSWRRRYVKFSLMMLAYILLVLVLARPQYGTRIEEVKRHGIETIIAVDVSNSMLCEDVTPSRLQKAKMIVSKLIDQLQEDRIGLIAFAGDAITLLPLTRDGVSAKMFLDQLSPQTVMVQGTNVSEAVRRAVAGFSSSQHKNIGRAFILITDAEDNEDGALDAVKEATRKGIKTFVLSIGTEEGGPIPISAGNYKIDKEGNTVITHLNEDFGRAIAKAGDGIYMHVDGTDMSQLKLKAELSRMQKQDMMSSEYTDFDEQFIAVAILLLIVLITEMCVMDGKVKRNIKFKIIILFICLQPFSHCLQAQTPNDNIRIGNRYYRKGDYVKAETYYRKALGQKKNQEVLYNIGNAQVMQGKDSLAYQSYKQALDLKSRNKNKQSQIYHNMGNVMYAEGLHAYKTGDIHANQMFAQAIDDYKSSIRLNPLDDRTKYNLALAQYMYKKTKNNQKQNQDQKQNQNKNNTQDKKNDKEQNKENKDTKPKNDNESQPQEKSDLDENNVQQLLNAAQQEEKRVQQKLIKQKPQHRSFEKDW